MTLKLEDDQVIVKMYLHAENEVVRLRQSKVFIMDDICTAITRENTKIVLSVKGQGAQVKIWAPSAIFDLTGSRLR